VKKIENRLRFHKVIGISSLPRFLWSTVYIGDVSRLSSRSWRSVECHDCNYWAASAYSIAVLCVDAVYCYRWSSVVCLSVCRSHPWALQKRLNLDCAWCRWEPCSNAAKTRNPLKFAGVPHTPEQISAVSGPKFIILWGRLGEILLFNKFFSDCQHMS